MLKAQIVQVYTDNGIERTVVKCPVCSKFHKHSKLDPARPMRVSHCTYPFECQEYELTFETVDSTPTATPQQLFLAKMLSGKFPKGLKPTEYGLMIDSSIQPTADKNDRFYKLDRARNAFHESMESEKLERIHSDLAASIAEEVNK